MYRVIRLKAAAAQWTRLPCFIGHPKSINCLP